MTIASQVVSSPASRALAVGRAGSRPSWVTVSRIPFGVESTVSSTVVAGAACSSACVRSLRIPDEEEAATDQLIVVADSLRAEGIATTWEVEEDTYAASGIVAKLRHRAFDLVALATHGRTGLSRLLAGSVATDVVRRAPAPVLLLRPEHLR
jgi:nucleotide-binding universal stress UspA family protein